MVKRKRFADLLRSRNITAYKLSKVLGFKDRHACYKWIYGKGEPNARMMLRLMDILDVSAEELLRIFGE